MTRQRTYSRTTLACAAAISLLAPASIHAATLTWTGTTDGDWNDASNWGGSGPPAEGDAMIFTGTSNSATNNDVGTFGVTGIQFNNTTAGESFTLGGTYLNWYGTISTADVVGGGSITDTISLDLRVTGNTRNFDLGADHHIDVTGKIWGPQGIRKLGDGTLTLSGANTYYGNATTISAGVLRVENDSALGNTVNGTTVESGAQLQLDQGVTISGEALTISGDGVGSSGALRGLTNNGDVEYAGNITLAADAKIFAGGGGTMTVSGTVDGAGNQLTLENGSPTLNVTGAITGASTSLVKAGSGTVTLSGINTYTGDTTINAGTLKLSGGSAIEDIGNVFVDTNGTLDLNDSNETIHKLTGSGTVDNTAAGTATLIVGAAGGNATFDGTITDTGAALKFRKIGSGSQTLTAANSYQGGTDIYEGTIVANDSAALGTGQIYMGVTNGVTQTLAIGAAGVNIANTFFFQNSNSTHEVKLDLLGTNSATLSGNMTNQVSYAGKWDFIVGENDTLTVSGVLKNGSAGGSGIDKDGAGTLVLSGANTYKGDTRINAGTLKLSGGSALADGAGKGDVTVGDFGTLDLNGTSETINGLSGTGIVDNTAGGGATLIVGNNNDTTTFSGIIQDTGGNLQLKKTGEGTLTLTAASTYSGGTNIAGVDSTANTVNVQHNNALGTARFLFERGGILELGVGGLTIGNRIEMPNWSGGTRTLKLDLDEANTGEFSGNMWHQNTTFGTVQFDVGTDDVLTYSGNMEAGSHSGAGIHKVGDGTLVLSGANTYKGKTSVEAGTLSLATGYTHGNSGYYEVIGGTLEIADGVNISTHAMTIGLDGVISPGNSPGTAITGSQTWNTGGSYLWEINNSGGSKGALDGWDWLDITGTLDLSNLTAGGFTIDIDSLTASNLAGDAVGFDTWTKGSPGDVDYSFTIATASAGITGFDAANFLLDSSGFSNAPSWDWQIVLSGNDLVLEAYAVPEPSSTALLGLGLSSLLLRRRRS